MGLGRRGWGIRMMGPKKIYELPIMQVIHSTCDVVAYSEEDAIEKFYEMDECELDYPFDYCSPQVCIDESEKIKCLGIVGGADTLTIEP